MGAGVGKSPKAEVSIGSYSCDVCKKIISKVRFSHSDVANYDLCEACFKRGAHGGVHYSSETEKPQAIIDRIAQQPTLRLTLKTAIKGFATRYCIGDIYESEKHEFNNPLSTDAGARLSRAAECETGLSVQWHTYGAIGGLAKKFGYALLPLVQSSFVGLCSNNRHEWIVADFACILMHIVTVPIHHKSDAAFIQTVANSTELGAIVCDLENIEQVLKASPQVASLKHVIVMDLNPHQQHLSPVELEQYASQYPNVRITTMSRLVQSPQAGIKSKPNPYENEATDLYTIVHTSGSTGVPKGVMISLGAWRRSLRSHYSSASHRFTEISFNSFAHTSPRRFVHMTAANGGKTALYGGAKGRIFEACRLIRPTTFASTPRLWNVLYDEYQGDMRQIVAKNEKILKKRCVAKLMLWNHLFGELTQFNERRARCVYYSWYYREMALFNRRKQEELNATYRDKLGGEVSVIVSGGAPTSADVLRFLKGVFMCYVGHGYGASEVAGIMNENGKPMDGVEVKLDSVPDLGYTLSDTPFPRGEILVKSPTAYSGYWKNATLTKEVFEGGWFRTGDIGVLTDEGLRIIDRKKNVFKMAQGVYIAPEKLELIFNDIKMINQIVVHGDSLEASLIAIILPSRTQIAFWAEERGIKLHYKRLSDPTDPVSHLLHEHVLSEMTARGRMHELKDFEIPRAIHIDFEGVWTAENGCLTELEKIKRPALCSKYKAEITRLYARINSPEYQIDSMLAQLLNVSSGDGEVSVTQAGGDSLTAMQLHNLIKAKFGVQIPLDILLARNREAIVREIEKLKDVSEEGGDIAAKELSERELVKKDLTLIDSLKPFATTTTQPDAGSENEESVVLLTGATGFFGAFLLHEIYRQSLLVEQQQLQNASEGEKKSQQSRVRILCLVRAKTEAEGRERVMKNLKKLGLPHASAKQQQQHVPNATNASSTASTTASSNTSAPEKVSNQQQSATTETAFACVVPQFEVVLGDLGQPQLGLSEEEFTKLATRVRVIYHCGALVNSLYDYSLMRATNVVGTATLIRLALEKRLKPIAFISTMSVLEDKSRLCAEAPLRLDTLGAGLRGYALSKWVAEALVTKARANLGLPCAVFRLCSVSGHRQTGRFNEADVNALILRALLKLRSYPEELTRQSNALNLVPVDFAARACVLVTRDKLHPSNSNAKSATNEQPRPKLSANEEYALTQPHPDLEAFSFATDAQFVYHVVNTHGAVPYAELLRHINSSPLLQSRPLTGLPYSLFRQLLAAWPADEKDEKLRRDVAHFFGFFCPQFKGQYSSYHLVEALHGHALQCSPIDQSLMHVYVRAFLELDDPTALLAKEKGKESHALSVNAPVVVPVQASDKSPRQHQQKSPHKPHEASDEMKQKKEKKEKKKHH